MTARIEALASQINPHFLFNTLNSISSLIRSRPETARMLIDRLSALLRRLPAEPGSLRHAAEELAAVDEYLDIECVRFGVAPACRQGHRPGDAWIGRRAEHDPAAAGRELDQARPGADKLGDGELTLRAARTERPHQSSR